MMSVITPGSPLTVEEQLGLLHIPKSSYYWKLKQPLIPLVDPAEIALRHRIQEICIEDSSYGYRRVTIELRKYGFLVNHKRVKRLMAEDNLLCMRRKAFVVPTTDSNHSFRVYPNLAASVVLDKIDQLWVADITYIHLSREFIYLAVILDAYSRRVIGWALSRHIDSTLTLDALTMALATRTLLDSHQRLIHHSDRGVQYACNAYIDALKSYGIDISMSRKGNPYDNAKAESFMKTLKQEEVYMNEYESLEHAKDNIGAFLHKYNTRRLHSSLGYIAPAKFEQIYNQQRMLTTPIDALSVQ